MFHTVRSSVGGVGLWKKVCALLFLANATAGLAWDTNEWQFLDTIERASLRYFQNEKRGPYQLLNDAAPYDGIGTTSIYSSVSGVGFELTAICLGHYRGWINSSNAYNQVLQTVKAFDGRLSADPEVFKKGHGWTYHAYRVDGPLAGHEAGFADGLSLIDHSMLVAGCIFVSEYFKGTEAADIARKIYADTEWSWRANNDYNYGYSEDLLAILESAAAPQFAKGTEAATMWNSYAIPPWPRNLQLYFWQFPHSWIDFRFRRDGRGVNHADVARDSILYQRQRAIDLHAASPAVYDMIGTNVWGWTAASSSAGYRQMAPWDLDINGVHYATEEASDSGSVTPFALPPCMVYAPGESMAALKNVYEKFYVNGWNSSLGELPVWSDVYGFLNCFNRGTPWAPGRTNWYNGFVAGIDHGPNVLLLENYKLGTTWRYFMQNANIATGLYTLGFGAQEHVAVAAFSNQANEFGMSFGHWQNGGQVADAAWISVGNVNAAVRDDAVRISASGANCGGWIDLNGTDQRAMAEMSFWLKGGTGAEKVSIGLKDTLGRENHVSLDDYTGGTTPTTWTQIHIPIEAFCLTGSPTNDTWPGSLALISFGFTNAGGGSLDLDSVGFSRDQVAPRAPTDGFGVAQSGAVTRLRWKSDKAERDVVGYHVWRRTDATSAFTRLTATLVPAFQESFLDITNAAGPGEEVRYALQALDNSEPPNASPLTPETTTRGGRLDVDWNDGRNPNALRGSQDGYWGGVTTQSLSFVYTNGPGNRPMWVRRSFVTSPWSGHFIDTAGSDAGDFGALTFYVRGTRGGERIYVGLKDTSNHEYKLFLNGYIQGGLVSTGWARATLPLYAFTNVDVTALANISFTHETTNDVLFAGLAFVQGTRAELVRSYYTESEKFALQSGSPTQDFKAAASGGQVLGMGWGADSGDFADYKSYVTRTWTQTTVRLRYACSQGTGRLFQVRWDDQVQASIICSNSGGWGDVSNQFRWATVQVGAITAGQHKLTFFASGTAVPVNLDAWYLTEAKSMSRECEIYDTQTGSQGPDLKPAASAGAVLGNFWGSTASARVIYSNVVVGAQTAAWLHVWYACAAPGGRTLNVAIDGTNKGQIVCARTAGWGDRVAHFGRASLFLGTISANSHALRFTVPNAGNGVNLDCFYIGTEDPTGAPDYPGTSGTGQPPGGGGGGGFAARMTTTDTDSDGLSDAAEGVAGTDALDPASRFDLSVTASPANDGFVLRWNSVSGRYYNIVSTPGLAARPFEPLATGLPATPPMNVYTDAVPPGEQRYYRLEVYVP